MMIKKTLSMLAGISLLIGLTTIAPAHVILIAQDKDKNDKKEKKEKKEKKAGEQKPAKEASGEDRDVRPVLWVEPADLESRDLFYGMGGAEGAPNPADKFTFVKRSTSGTSEKIIVNDNKGREWTVKFGPEC